MSRGASGGISSRGGRQLLRALREAAALPVFESCPDCGGAVKMGPRRDGAFYVPGSLTWTCGACGWQAPPITAPEG